MSQTKAQLIDPVDGTIVNADINASAAIAGSKISPAFTSNITGTGDLTLSSGGSDRLKMTHAGGGQFVIKNPSAAALSFGTNNQNNELFIANGGNVGIGTSSPSGTLHIESSSEYCLKINKSDSTAAYLQFYNSTTGSSTSDGFRLGIDSNEDALFSLRESGNIKFATTNTERMRIDSSGKVGIGATPDKLFHVERNDDSTTAIAKFKNSGTGDTTLQIGNASTNFVLGMDNSDSDKFKFGYGSALESITGLTIDSSGNVGIGTVSPAQKLHVVGTAVQFQNTQSTFIQTNTSDTHFYTGGSHPLRFGTNSTERMRIDSSGKVGIGTTSPNKLLHIQDAAISQGYSSQSSTLLVLEDSGDTSLEIGSGHNNTGSIFFGDTGSSNKGQINYLHGSLGDAMTFQTNDAERMRIDSSGNVGIGTTSVGTTNGAIGLKFGMKSDNNNAITFETTNATTNRGLLLESRLTGRSGGETFAQMHMTQETGGQGGFIRFYTAPNGSGTTERLRIHSDGKVDVGGNSGLGSKFVVRDTSFDVFGVYCASESHGTIATIKGGTSGSPAGTLTYISFQRNDGNTRGSITNSGSTQLSFNTSSDYRLKENAISISDGITRLKTLKPYRFNFKDEPDRTIDGFFAHEVTAVPEAITGTKDEVDSDNNPVYQGIDQSKLVPLLVAAVQELITKVETLESA